MSQPKTDILGGYGFALRTFYVTCSQLVVTRFWSVNRWSSDERKLPDVPPRLEMLINGIATIDLDSISVIGKKDNPKELSLRLTSDTNSKTKWEDHRASVEVLARDAPHPLKEELYKRLSKTPPTADLSVFEEDLIDDEFKTTLVKKGWYLECQVPYGILSELVSDIVSGRIEECKIGIDWEMGAIRYERTPPHRPADWGVITYFPETTPEPLWGCVTFLNWQPTARKAHMPKVN